MVVALSPKFTLKHTGRGSVPPGVLRSWLCRDKSTRSTTDSTGFSAGFGDLYSRKKATIPHPSTTAITQAIRIKVRNNGHNGREVITSCPLSVPPDALYANCGMVARQGLHMIAVHFYFTSCCRNVTHGRLAI